MPAEHDSHVNHRSRMRERYNRCGIDSFAEHEVLEVYLYRCLRRMNTNDIAHNLLKKFSSLSRVFARQNTEQYREVAFVGEKIAFTLRESAETMENMVVTMLRDRRSYDPGSAMVFARYMLKRLPGDSVLVLRYAPDGAFLDYAVFPFPDNRWEDGILNCLSASKPGEELHIRFCKDIPCTVESCLQLSMELCVHARKLRSVHRIHCDGEVEVLYE